MRSVTTEIVNFHSHSNADIVIYTKDAYIEDGSAYYINISSITISSHPDYLAISKNAIIIPTSITQNAITNQARFHLLKNTDLLINETIAAGDFSDIENEIFITDEITIKLSRTSLSLQNLDFYREEDTVKSNLKFIVGLYLHDKGIIMSKSTQKFQTIIIYFQNSNLNDLINIFLNSLMIQNEFLIISYSY